MNRILDKSDGFTLVELMITLVITGMIMAAVYSVYVMQQRTYAAQSQVTMMQQNIRSALNLMLREIRMAGYDPAKTGGAGIVKAEVGRLAFIMDVNEDGKLDPNETITYGFSLVNDTDNNGVADAGAASLGRDTGGGAGYQPIAESIQAVQFRYLDADGVVTADLNEIRFVDISILARADLADPDFTNSMTYTPASGIPWDLNGAAAGQAPNDHFRRQLLIARVQCRNMGL